MSLIQTTKTTITDTLGSVSAISNVITNTIQGLSVYSRAISMNATKYIDTLEATMDYAKATDIEDTLCELDKRNADRDYSNQQELKIKGQEYSDIYMTYVQARKNNK